MCRWRRTLVHTSVWTGRRVRPPSRVRGSCQGRDTGLSRGAYHQRAVGEGVSPGRCVSIARRASATGMIPLHSPMVQLSWVQTPAHLAVVCSPGYKGVPSFLAHLIAYAKAMAMGLGNPALLLHHSPLACVSCRKTAAAMKSEVP